MGMIIAILMFMTVAAYVMVAMQIWMSVVCVGEITAPVVWVEKIILHIWKEIVPLVVAGVLMMNRM